MLISQTIPHLLNGVSQRPGTARHPTQLSSLVNGHGTLVSGLMKRPPAEYLGKLQASTTGWDSLFAHAVNRDDNERFLVTIANGSLKVFDMTAGGAEITVEDRSGGSYLSGASNGYRAVTIGDDTYIVNRSKTVVMDTAYKESIQTPYALVTVEQSHFSTKYEILINGETVARYTTPAMSSAQAAELVSTDKIAEELALQFGASTESSSGWSFFHSDSDTLGQAFTCARFGSTLHIYTTASGADFDITVRDGLSDQGLYLIKGECQSFEDLPVRAPNGTKVKIVGDFREDQDDYWVEFDAGETGDEIGVWRECPAPGSQYRLKRSTMPHRLRYEGSYIEEGMRTSDLPREPALSDLQTETDYGFDEDETGSPRTDTDDEIIKENLKGVQKTIGDADSTLAYIIARYDIETGNVPFGVDTIVQLWNSSDYPSGDPLAEKTYRPGESYLGESIRAKDTWGPTDKALVTLAYGTGTTPSSDNRAILTVLGKSTLTREKRNEPLTYANALKKRVTYRTGTYPEGMKVELRLDDSETFTHTVTAGGETASEVASAMQVLVNGSATYTATASSHYVDIYVTSSGDRPEVTYTKNYLPDTIAYVAGAGWTVNEFAGVTVYNQSDGSSATVTSNTANTITATLTGGADNAFSEGDWIKIVGDASTFVFEEVPWEDRDAGDDLTNPKPSFVDEEITDVFFYRNRLGFLSGANVIFSESGEFTNFWRTTVYDLLDGDPIDVRSAGSEVAVWHSAVALDTRLFLWSENGQYELSGEPLLSPKTVRLDLLSRYYNASNVRPQVVGNRIYFLHQQTGNTRVFLWQPPTEDNPQGSAREITSEVPTYLSGAPVDMVGDSGLGFMAVLSDTDQTDLYTFTWAPEQFAGWGQWSFDADMVIVQTDLIDNKLLLVTKQTDGIFLYEVDLDIPNTPAASEQWAYLDQKFTVTDQSLNGSDTDITTPYDIGVGKTLTVIDTATGTSYSASRVNATTARVTGEDLTGLTLSCGRLYEFRARLSPVYYVGRDDQPERLGRLQLRYIELHYQDTTEFDVEVTPQGRTAYTYSVAQASPRDGTLRFPVLTRAEDATIEIVQDTEGGARIVALDWEGFAQNRARSV